MWNDGEDDVVLIFRVFGGGEDEWWNQLRCVVVFVRSYDGGRGGRKVWGRCPTGEFFHWSCTMSKSSCG